jgi:exopolysaccharide production protein ExoZ
VPALGVGWSLNYERFFYLCFAIALLLPRRVSLTALVAALTYVGFRGAQFHAPQALLYRFNTMLVEFVFGVVIGWVYFARVKVPLWLATLACHSAPLAYSPAQSSISRRALIGRGGRYGCLRRNLPSRRGTIQPLKLGDMSYSLYLFHNLIMMLIRIELARYVEPLARYPWAYLLLSCWRRSRAATWCMSSSRAQSRDGCKNSHHEP